MGERAGFGLRVNTTISGSDPILPSRFAVGESTAVALAAIGSAAADLADQAGGAPGQVKTSAQNGALTAIGFAVQRLNGNEVPRTNQSNPFVHCYLAGDGRWIYIHGGFPTLRAGLADLLGVSADATHKEVGSAVMAWEAMELEDKIADRSLCGAMVRSADEWVGHPQGKAVLGLNTVEVAHAPGSKISWEPSPDRPLRGLRVLDLTRVLAGPTCGKYLAALGAKVSNLRAAHVPVVPSFFLETGVGKSVVNADLRQAEDLQHVRTLAMDSHVIVQGYRPGVVERFGLDAVSLRSQGWNGVFGNISCYGHQGPWRNRAGWEQLAQTVSGMAAMEGSADRPVQVPAALNDYTTGLLMAAAVTRQLADRTPADLFGSLCQTAAWIVAEGATCDPNAATGIGKPELQFRKSAEGTHLHLSPGFTVQGLDVSWAGSSSRIDPAESSVRR